MLLKYLCDVTTERDLVPGFLTLIACLALGVEMGIMIGVAVDIAFLLYFSARPGIQVERLQVGALIIFYLLTIHRLLERTELQDLVEQNILFQTYFHLIQALMSTYWILKIIYPVHLQIKIQITSCKFMLHIYRLTLQYTILILACFSLPFLPISLFVHSFFLHILGVLFVSLVHSDFFSSILQYSTNVWIINFYVKNFLCKIITFWKTCTPHCFFIF